VRPIHAVFPWLLGIAACHASTASAPPSLSPLAPPPELPAPAAKATLMAPEAAPPYMARLQVIDEVVDEALHDGKLPGCVVVVGRHDRVVFRRAYGMRSIEPTRTPMTEDTVFDLASLTKSIASATSILMLVEQGQVALDEPVAKYIPEFARMGKGSVTVRQLLTHVAGLPGDTPLSSFTRGREAALQYVYDSPLMTSPGTKFVYSDVGFMVLGEIVRRVSGVNLGMFAQTNLFDPLGMHDTAFLPPEPLRLRAAPTEMRDGHWMQGEVHDPRAYMMGGVAGHAGLFSTGDDLARFAQAILRDGELDGARILSKRTVSMMTAPHDVPGAIRALGWDVRSGFSSNRGDSFSLRAFGHGGFTGTSLWIDPERDVFVVFLSNRVHPDGHGAVNPLAGRIASIGGAAFEPVPGACDTATGEVKSGLDVLQAEDFKRLRGAHVGLITNVTGRSRDGRFAAELFAHAPDVQLVALFTPEHGLGANAEGKIADARDESLDVPIYSLYGANFRPTAEQLRGIDTLVFDVQDAGTRFYTYPSTMRRAMETAADNQLQFFVLDRPAPINGLSVAGPVLDPGIHNFVNHHPLPVRHGMTIGELAELFNADDHMGVSLHVVKMQGWRRDAYYDATGLPWINPSPNLRSVDEALLYPGVGLLEASNVSVGRGTEEPFETVGAPWIDGVALATALAQEPLAGVTFSPAEFTPESSVYKGDKCNGIRITVSDRDAFEPVRTGLAIARELATLYRGQWHVEDLGKLVASPKVVDAVRAGKPLAEIEALWDVELKDWRNKREKYLLYPSTPCAP
jgi:uncharacterized protein YbbC (DUF1343 family)